MFEANNVSQKTANGDVTSTSTSDEKVEPKPPAVVDTSPVANSRSSSKSFKDEILNNGERYLSVKRICEILEDRGNTVSESVIRGLIKNKELTGYRPKGRSKGTYLKESDFEEYHQKGGFYLEMERLNDEE